MVFRSGTVLAIQKSLILPTGRVKGYLYALAWRGGKNFFWLYIYLLLIAKSICVAFEHLKDLRFFVETAIKGG